MTSVNTGTKWLSQSKRDENKLVELKGLIIDESEKGLFIVYDEEKPALWFPKSKCEQIKVTGDNIECLVPKWLADSRRGRKQES